MCKLSVGHFADAKSCKIKQKTDPQASYLNIALIMASDLNSGISCNKIIKFIRSIKVKYHITLYN